MSNNLATLNAKLARQLRDEAYAVWTTGEMDDLVTWAVADLWPTVPRYIDPTTTTITLVSGTYFYAIPSGIKRVTEVDWVDTAGNELGPVYGYQIVGEIEDGTGKIQVSPVYTDGSGGTLRIHGYGAYDTTTNLIQDRFVPLVLAIARGEAYRRMGADRAQFENWQDRAQVRNVSVNELILMTNEADAEARQLRQRLVKRTLPVVARRA